MSQLTPATLLTVAEDLIPSVPGRPAVALLRRAVSTAYYAVFCAITTEVGSQFAPPLSLVVRRLVTHAAARDVLRNLGQSDGKGNTTFNWLPDRPLCHPGLEEFARSFLLLLDNRESADYDHRWTISKSGTKALIEEAENAIGQLAKAKASAPLQVQAVSAAILVAPQVRKRMKFNPK